LEWKAPPKRPVPSRPVPSLRHATLDGICCLRSAATIAVLRDVMHAANTGKSAVTPRPGQLRLLPPAGMAGCFWSLLYHAKLPISARNLDNQHRRQSLSGGLINVLHGRRNRRAAARPASELRRRLVLRPVHDSGALEGVDTSGGLKNSLEDLSGAIEMMRKLYPAATRSRRSAIDGCRRWWLRSDRARPRFPPTPCPSTPRPRVRSSRHHEEGVAHVRFAAAGGTALASRGV
jgi:hypothetical protein